jgi:uncharacterized protein (DUF2147 family)
MKPAGTLTRLVPLALAAVSLIALACGPAFAQDPSGVWLSADGDVKMKVSSCGNAICGAIAWLKDPNDEHGKPKLDRNNPDAGKRGRPLVGSLIMVGMKPDGAGKWSGDIYNARDGKTYSGTFSLTGSNSAALRGCLAIFCQSKAWTRSN